jgi:hypothetical protein
MEKAIGDGAGVISDTGVRRGRGGRAHLVGVAVGEEGLQGCGVDGTKCLEEGGVHRRGGDDGAGRAGGQLKGGRRWQHLGGRR